MKFRIILMGTILLAGMADGSFADCTSTQVTDTTTPTLFDFLKNNTVCVSDGSGGWKNQEYHSTNPSGSGYELIDWKMGSDPKDPTGKVGTWNVSGTGGANTFVTYVYDDGGTYQYTVHDNGGGSITFCEGTTPNATASYYSGQVACH